MEKFLDGIAALAASGGLILAGWLSVGIEPVMPILAQVVAGHVDGESLLEFAIRQGGAFGVLFVVLFYYRRDYRDLVSYKDNRDKIMVDLVKENSRTQAEVASALREHGNIIRNLAGEAGPPISGIR